MAGILGVDVGGTFTDFLLFEDGRLRAFKRPSTPWDPGRAILAGIAEMRSAPTELVHGSTVATNAVLERKGARTALVTTRGFGDVLEIGRQTRPRIYDLEPHRPQPLVPRERRYELAERVAADGTVLWPAAPDDVEAVVERALADGAESLAISLLFSYLNPEHERLVAAAARRRGLWVSASCELVPEYREFERTSTTVANAFVAPVVTTYLRSLERQAREAGIARLRIVQSDGGSAGVETVARRAVSTVLSGPAAGVAGAFAAARASGFDDAITFDMGGTSTDVALCPGRIVERVDVEIGGLPLRVPAIDVHTVGAGGGSLARIDAGGALRVGPQSAGAEPGPACYGRGSEPTVTDAQLVLGRLQAEHFLGGRMRLEARRAREAIAKLGGDVAEQAAAILRVANANMERAIRVISVERGYDPRTFTLVAFGGAGPLHACDLAESLRIPRVLVPPSPGVLSAFGMVTAPVTRVYQRPVMRTIAPGADDGVAALLERLARELEAEGRADLAADGYGPAGLVAECNLDMRYVGQSYELSVPFPHPNPLQSAPPLRRPSGRGNEARPGALSEEEGESAAVGAGLKPARVPLPGTELQPDIVAAFHERHRQRYGHADSRRAVEVVNLRCRVSAPGQEPLLERPAARPGGVERARLGSARQWYGRWSDAPVYDRGLLFAGDRLDGPAVVVQMDATTALPPGWTAVVDEAGSLVLEGRRDAGRSGRGKRGG